MKSPRNCANEKCGRKLLPKPGLWVLRAHCSEACWLEATAKRNREKRLAEEAKP